MRAWILFLFYFPIAINTCLGQNLKLMTYNIRFDNPDDGENRWDLRKKYLCKLIEFHSPDIIGTQEGLTHQLNYLDSALTGYTYIGVGRDDGKKKGEYCAIFYDQKVLKLLMHATFWLSERPDTISKGWDAALPRICTYAKFQRIADGKKFWVFNTHFDHIGELARKYSASLILEKIETLNKKVLPVFLLGDFNLEPETEPVQLISSFLNDSKFAATEIDYGPEGTFNGFNFNQPVNKRIDYIFADKLQIKVLKHAILNDSYNCHYPSDHLPVLSEIFFMK